MKHPTLKFDENHQPVIEGNFEFKVSPTFVSEGYMEPLTSISFLWNPEMSQDIEAFHNTKDIYEMIGEKLKQDFIKLATTGIYEVHKVEVGGCKCNKEAEKIISKINKK